MNQPAIDPRVQREKYYQRIAAKNLTPLWEVLASLVPEKPASPCVTDDLALRRAAPLADGVGAADLAPRKRCAAC